jgi:hypothetical protein
LDLQREAAEERSFRPDSEYPAENCFNVFVNDPAIMPERSGLTLIAFIDIAQ